MTTATSGERATGDRRVEIAAMSEWQPIETAPIDAPRDVLLWNGERVFLGWLHSRDGWIDSTMPDHMCFAEDPQPTHWMPLPAPPGNK